MVAQLSKLTVKIIELYILDGGILWYVNSDKTVMDLKCQVIYA